MLLAVHEELLMEIVKKWNSDKEEGETLEEFQNKMMSTSNHDEVSRFWSVTLDYLNAYLGYYISIRSGH